MNQIFSWLSCVGCFLNEYLKHKHAFLLLLGDDGWSLGAIPLKRRKARLSYSPFGCFQTYTCSMCFIFWFLREKTCALRTMKSIACLLVIRCELEFSVARHGHPASTPIKRHLFVRQAALVRASRCRSGRTRGPSNVLGLRPFQPSNLFLRPKPAHPQRHLRPRRAAPSRCAVAPPPLTAPSQQALRLPSRRAMDPTPLPSPAPWSHRRRKIPAAPEDGRRALQPRHGTAMPMDGGRRAAAASTGAVRHHNCDANGSRPGTSAPRSCNCLDYGPTTTHERARPPRC